MIHGIFFFHYASFSSWCSIDIHSNSTICFSIQRWHALCTRLWYVNNSSIVYIANNWHVCQLTRAVWKRVSSRMVDTTSLMLLINMKLARMTCQWRMYHYWHLNPRHPCCLMKTTVTMMMIWHMMHQKMKTVMMMILLLNTLLMNQKMIKKTVTKKMKDHCPIRPIRCPIQQLRCQHLLLLQVVKVKHVQQ